MLLPELQPVTSSDAVFRFLRVQREAGNVLARFISCLLLAESNSSAFQQGGVCKCCARQKEFLEWFEGNEGKEEMRG